jgi:hypothetical protein
MPEYAPLETRIDSAAAELITLAEADKRFGGQRGPAGYGPGQTPDSLTWWVTVYGYFRYEGMPFPDGTFPTYEANERDFTYDAQTGESMGSRISGPPRLVATREAEMTVQPSPTFEGEETTTPLATESAHPEHCHVAGNETYTNQESRYCFAYPSRFKLVLDNAGQPVLSGPPLDQSANPLFASMGIQVQAAPEGSNLTQVVDEYLKPFATVSAPAITRKSLQLDREAAQILEVVPGRVGSRDIFSIYGGRVYHLAFTPSVRDFPKAAKDVEELFKTVTSSFTFLP